MDELDLVFLGVNDAGKEIYDWLCDRNDVSVECLITEEAQLELISELTPDLIVAAGFQHIVPPDVLSIPNRGCINVHPGYLPHARGFNPNVWSIVEELPAGVTIHYMDEGVDTGDVISRSKVETSFADTGKDLYERLEIEMVDLFIETWPEIRSGSIDPVEQGGEPASYHVKQDFIDLCEIDMNERVEVGEFLNRLRALTFPPYQNAHVEVDGEKYFIDIEITPADTGTQDNQNGFVDAY